MSNNTVTFKVAGNDVLSFMDRMKSKAAELTSNMLSNAQREAVSSKEQLKIVEDQIKAIERKTRIETEGARQSARVNRDQLKEKNKDDHETRVAAIKADSSLSSGMKGRKISESRETAEIGNEHADKGYKEELTSLREQERNGILQTKLLKDNIETIKQSTTVQVSQLRKNNGELVDELDKNATPMEEFARTAALEKYDDEKKTGKKERNGESMFGSLLGVDNINKLLGTMQTFTSTQNGFDLIKPASQGVGQIVGAIAGGLIGMLAGPGGAVVGAGIGGSIGSTIGGGVGEFEQRRAMAAQEFLHSKFAYEATTQKSMPGIPDNTSLGVAASEYLATLKQIAVATGSTQRAVENTNDVIEMQKGVGISQDTSSQFITLFRGTQKDISNLVTGVMEKGKSGMFAGGDYTFLNEMLQKMGSLQQMMQNNTEHVSTGASYDIINKFSALGGAFRAVDPRSAGLIGQVNNALVNPSSDSGNAMSLMALRKANPNMGIADLMMEREKGLSSPLYLRSMLEQVESMGGNDQFKRMNIAGLFGVNQSAAKRIFDGRKGLMSGKVSSDEIEDMISGNFRGAAAERTTPIEKNEASIKNSLLSDWTLTLDAMQDSFKIAMESAFNGATIQMNNGTITFGGQVKQNKIKSGKADADMKDAAAAFGL
jgi:hypothetical protein